MAMNNETVEVKLGINASGAEKELSDLRKKADDLRKALAQASNAGDTKSIKTLQKDLSATTRQITRMQSSAKNVDDVMRRLNKASLSELRQTLRTLNKEFDRMGRGTSAWNVMQQKINRVKKEIAAAKNGIEETGSAMDSFTLRLSKGADLLRRAFETVTRLVSTARQFVQSYADMDAAMANTRKFTGMTRSEVEALNGEFKKMDTRSSREQLNELAQSAGRLGKTTQEEVLDFVRAGGIPALPGPCLSRLLEATRA